jgi:hypothetical protein
MTAGQFATPHRQVQASMLVAALVVAYGVGLLTGLVVPRTVGQETQIAGPIGAVHQLVPFTAPFASMPAAARQGTGVNGFRGAQDFRAAQDSQPASAPVTARQGTGVTDYRGAQDLRAAQDSQRATRLGGP